MSTNEEIEKPLGWARGLYIALFLGTLAFIGVLRIDLDATPDLGTNIVNIIAVTLFVLAVMNFILAYRFPHRLLKGYRQKSLISGTHLFISSILSAALMEAIAIYGLLLYILGLSWQLAMVFILVSAVGLVLTFPSETKWQKVIIELNKDSPLD